jgi:hypothetical protein
MKQRTIGSCDNRKVQNAARTSLAIVRRQSRLHGAGSNGCGGKGAPAGGDGGNSWPGSQLPKERIDSPRWRRVTSYPPMAYHPPTETGLPGWVCRIRTGESVREPLDWDCGTISPEVGANPAAEILPVPAAGSDFAALGKRHFALDFSRKRSMNGARMQSLLNRLAPLTPPAP